MQRPQSASHGNKGHWTQFSSENFPQEGIINQQQLQKRQVKIVRPNLTTNDFSRILPKKICHDKQKLYSQALQLKQHMNELKEQNTKLRTRITIIEKQKQKLKKQQMINQNDLNGRISNAYQTKFMEVRIKFYDLQKENGIVRNLKKMIRQAKEESELLKNENKKIKKVIKYTKINELEVQKKMLIDENKRISLLMQQFKAELKDQNNYERQMQDIQEELEEVFNENEELKKKKAQYEEQIERLQGQWNQQTQRYNMKQKRLQRQLVLAKRKINQQNRKIQDLSREIRNIKEQTKKNSTENRKVVRPVSSNPYSRNSIKGQLTRVTTENKQEYQDVKIQNSRLQNQVAQLKQQLQTNKSKPQKNISKKTEQQQKQPKFFLKEKESKNEIDEYGDDFEQKPEQFVMSNKQKKQFSKDFSSNQETEKLYDKNQQSNKKQKSSEKKKKKKKKDHEVDKKKKKIYKPNIKMLSQIKAILTYRMKAQRYIFQELQDDILQSQKNQFFSQQLEVMLRNQPFILSENQAKIFLQYCYESEEVKLQEILSINKLIEKLRKVIDKFELVPENTQKQILQRVQQMTSNFAEHLNHAFENIKNGEQTVSKQDLVQMFKKFSFDKTSIECIVAQLSLYSQNLEHLNYYSFFERFYTQNENQMINNAIQQEQQDGYSGSLKQDRNQLQEDAPFILEQPQETAKTKKNFPEVSDQQIISDD